MPIDPYGPTRDASLGNWDAVIKHPSDWTHGGSEKGDMLLVAPKGVEFMEPDGPGTAAGAMIGAPAGPVGAAVGGFVGGLGGALVGGFGGSMIGEGLGEWVYDLLD